MLRNLYRHSRAGYALAAILIAGCITWLSISGIVSTRAGGASAFSGLEVVPAEVSIQGTGKAEQKSVTLVVHNRSSRNITVADIRASCGCTIPKALASHTIERGRSIDIAVDVEVPVHGVRESVVTIVTDSAETSKLQIPIHISGKKLAPPFMGAGPGEVRVEVVSGGEPVSRSFQVTCVETPGKRWLQGFRSDSPLATVKNSEMVGEQVIDGETVTRDYVTTLELKPDSVAETNRSIRLIPITRSIPTSSFPLISINLVQVTPIRCAPSKLLCTFANDSGDQIQRGVVLIGAGEKTWKITSIKEDSKDVHCDIVTPGVNAKLHRINIVITRPGPGSAHITQHQIIVKTTHPQSPQVVLPLTVVTQSSM